MNLTLYKGFYWFENTKKVFDVRITRVFELLGNLVKTLRVGKS